MFDKNTGVEIISYITLDAQNAEGSIKKVCKDKKMYTDTRQAISSDNEWQLEYKLIYDSQKFEDWNI